jgi:hypothetical protein
LHDLAAAPLFLHLRGDGLRHEQEPTNIDAELTVKICFRHLAERPHVENAGVVDENVDAAECFDRLRDRRRDLILVTHIETHGDGRRAE